MVTTISVITPAQKAEPNIERPRAANETVVTTTCPRDNERRTGDDLLSKPGSRLEITVELERFIEMESQRRFNEFHRLLLDDRAETLDRWISVGTVLLTFFTIIVAIVGIVVSVLGFLGVRKIRGFVDEVKNIRGRTAQHEKQARKLVEGIRGKLNEAAGLVHEITAETAALDPKGTNQAVERVLENPQASLMDRAIARAVSYQSEGKADEAIELWRSIARFSEGDYQDLAAQAWFSIGYLIHAKNPADSIPAYDKAILLNPRLAGAFTNRGNAKAALERYQDAIFDHTEAIRLDRSVAEAYNNRGVAKQMLKLYEEAIADHSKAIFLNPDLLKAYSNRGECKFELGLVDEARADLETARTLARKAGEIGLASDLEHRLSDINDP